MTLVAMTIPDDPARIPGWLERQLTGPDLGLLVAELSAIHGPPANPASSVGDLLGASLDPVLRRGLGILPISVVKHLLIQPELLLELQEIVLCAGSPYWDRLTVGGEIGAMVEKGWEALRETLPLDAPPVLRAGGWWQTWGAGAAVVAAVLLIGTFLHPLFTPLFRPPEPPAVAWGWARAGGVPAGVAPAEYLGGLADVAREWFDRRPEDPAGLEKRIGEMRQGCRALLAADHAPLPPADKAWLVERCRAWDKKFAEADARVRAGADPREVRNEVDATVEKLTAALRERAGKRTPS